MCVCACTCMCLSIDSIQTWCYLIAAPKDHGYHSSFCHNHDASEFEEFKYCYELVSGIHSSKTGDRCIEIQHCIDLSTEKQCKAMRFLVASACSSCERLKVTISDEGYFSVYSQFGKLHVNEAVTAAIIYKVLHDYNVLMHDLFYNRENQLVLLVLARPLKYCIEDMLSIKILERTPGS